MRVTRRQLERVGLKRVPAGQVDHLHRASLAGSATSTWTPAANAVRCEAPPSLREMNQPLNGAAKIGRETALLGPGRRGAARHEYSAHLAAVQVG